MKLHYIAISGAKGCLPDYCQSFAARKDAIDSLVALFELAPRGKFTQQLETCDYVSFPKHLFAGADYAEIQKCACDNPSIHNDGDDN